MSDYEIIFALEPTGPFGLPQEGATVMPPGTEWKGPPIDMWSRTVAGHGTLSQYRTTPVEGFIELPAAKLRLHDNFLFVTLAAPTDAEAVSLAERHASRFCMGLTMKVGTYFHARLQGASRRDTQSSLQLPVYLPFGLQCWYNLSHMRDAVTGLGMVLGADDAKLDRALSYFYHAAFLTQSLNRIEDRLSFHAYYTLTEAILNFYKAMSVIVGDPSCADKPQSLYKTYNISRELWNRTNAVRRARNDMDVAHYKASPEQFGKVQEAAGEATKVATEVIQAYVSWLTKNATANAGT